MAWHLKKWSDPLKLSKLQCQVQEASKMQASILKMIIPLNKFKLLITPICLNKWSIESLACYLRLSKFNSTPQLGGILEKSTDQASYKGREFKFPNQAWYCCESNFWTPFSLLAVGGLHIRDKPHMQLHICLGHEEVAKHIHNHHKQGLRNTPHSKGCQNPL